MEKFALLVIGRGKLATELLNGLQSPEISGVTPWDRRDTVQDGRCIVVHAGSGRPDSSLTPEAHGSVWSP
ncbi:MAG: hypothetical protein Q7J24_05935 [Desulfomicrobium sp.]|nr:hypothetical protein [Desulfomicrobium sp.]